MLLMKKAFFEAIRTGRKTTTLRYWKHRRVRPGSVHTVPGLGAVRIEDVQIFDLKSLTSADAATEGLASVRELRRVLRQIYPARSRRGCCLYRIRFTYLDGKAPR